MRTAAVTLLFSIVAASGCGATVSDAGVSVVIATLNLEGGGDRHYGESEEATTERYSRIALRYFLPHEGFWGLVGLTEVRYFEEQATPISPKYLNASLFNCSTPTDVYGADCFGKYIGAVYADTHGELGWDADPFMEVIPESFRWDFIGDAHATIIHRTVMGARFRLKYYPELIIPFYVVHLGGEWHAEEIRDAIKRLHSWYVDGDMPPVLVGDFNCHNFDQDLQNEVLNEFADATGGVAEVNRILVSRPQNYPSANWRWAPLTPGGGRLIDLGGTTYTDHSAVAATLRIDRARTSPMHWPPPAPPQPVWIDPLPDPLGTFVPGHWYYGPGGCPTTVS